MPGPFPGMAPYLENPQYWRAIHARLIGALDDAIREQLPAPLFTTQHPIPWHYGVCLHRGGTGRVYQVWLASVRERLPIFTIPLIAAFSDLIIDLNRVVAQVYAEGRFENRIDYRQEPLPPLAPMDAVWADTLLRGAGVR